MSLKKKVQAVENIELGLQSITEAGVTTLESKTSETPRIIHTSSIDDKNGEQSMRTSHRLNKSNFTLMLQRNKQTKGKKINNSVQ